MDTPSSAIFSAIRGTQRPSMGKYLQIMSIWPTSSRLLIAGTLCGMAEFKASEAQTDRALRYDVYISYTKDGDEWAEWIGWQLESIGLTVLFQKWHNVPGTHWDKMMEEGARNAAHTVAVCTPNYLDSSFGNAEAVAAYQSDADGVARRLIPVLVAAFDWSGLLDGVTPITLVGLDEPAAQTQLETGMRSAMKGTARPLRAPDFPGIRGSDRTTVRSVPKRPPFPAAAQGSLGQAEWQAEEPRTPQIAAPAEYKFALQGSERSSRRDPPKHALPDEASDTSARSRSRVRAAAVALLFVVALIPAWLLGPWRSNGSASGPTGASPTATPPASKSPTLAVPSVRPTTAAPTVTLTAAATPRARAEASRAPRSAAPTARSISLPVGLVGVPVNVENPATKRCVGQVPDVKQVQMAGCANEKLVFIFSAERHAYLARGDSTGKCLDSDGSVTPNPGDAIKGYECENVPGFQEPDNQYYVAEPSPGSTKGYRFVNYLTVSGVPLCITITDGGNPASGLVLQTCASQGQDALARQTWTIQS